MFGGVGRRDGLAVGVERDEADAAFDDERVLAAGDDVAEAHPPDRVERRATTPCGCRPSRRRASSVRRNGRFDARRAVGRVAGESGDRRRSRRPAALDACRRSARRSAAADRRPVERRLARWASGRRGRSGCRRQIARRLRERRRGDPRIDSRREQRSVGRHRAALRARSVSDDVAADGQVVGDERRRVEQHVGSRANARSGRDLLGEVVRGRSAICQFRSASRIGVPVVEPAGQRVEQRRSAGRLRCGRAPDSRGRSLRAGERQPRRAARLPPRGGCRSTSPEPARGPARRAAPHQVRRQEKDVGVADVVAEREDHVDDVRPSAAAAARRASRPNELHRARRRRGAGPAQPNCWRRSKAYIAQRARRPCGLRHCAAPSCRASRPS